MATERLQKILSHAGVASRRRAEELIVQGRVAVNGVVQTQLGSRADPERDEITVDGIPIDRRRYRYVMFHKPAGVVCTAEDEMGRETIYDLLPEELRSLHYVGRLDKESEGLLLLTNDGHLTNLLTHPSHEVEKEYLVAIDRPLPAEALQRLVRGIRDEGELLRAHSVRVALPDEPGWPGRAWLLVTLREGKKREIRRMLAAVGRDVLRLRRIRIGSLRLGELPPGAWRDLDASEVTRLYELAAYRSPFGARLSGKRDRLPSRRDGQVRPEGHRH